MVKRDREMCEKQQLACVFAPCQSGLNMACFWHFPPSHTHSFPHTLSVQKGKKGSCTSSATFTLFLIYVVQGLALNCWFLFYKTEIETLTVSHFPDTTHHMTFKEWPASVSACLDKCHTNNQNRTLHVASEFILKCLYSHTPAVCSLIIFFF